MAIADQNKTGVGLRGILPVGTVLLLAIVMVLPYKIPYFVNLMPFLTLIAVYYWTVVRPELLPVSAVFLVGLVQDILSGGPLGMMALLLLLVRQFVLLQGRNFLERDFLFNWLIFMLISLAFGAVSWALASLYYKAVLNFWNALGQSLLTIALFPVITWVLGGVRKRLKGG
ncbi:rod shape-determining protein MreD [Luteithermobacter gelatinilyticus]|uniref:rod shape-determining protein MreD n=1 Tax=Luteithermobacter gelatinilyticus TaxID=2582913 RepID=UPI001105F61B|nr:rod shape-determining protein MreD [Luteithermobacter gelatinilyticus]